MWDEIINPFLNCNGCTVDNWEWISNLILLVMLGLQFKLFIKSEPRMKYGIERYICFNISIIDLRLYLINGQLHGKNPKIEHNCLEYFTTIFIFSLCHLYNSYS